MNKLTTLSVVTLLSAVTSLPGHAGVIVGPTAVSSPQGDFGTPNELINTINQSGLSAGYTSGVTDFATFTSTATHADLTGTGFTGTEDGGPQQFSFDLGALLTVDAIAIWNTDSVGRVTSFRVLLDNDADFLNGTVAELIGPTALGGFGPAQVFGFAPTAARFIHIEGLSSLSSPDFYGLGEVAFDSLGPAAAPLPGTLALLGIGLAGFATARRRGRGS